jgi:hypothetical protein
MVQGSHLSLDRPGGLYVHKLLTNKILTNPPSCDIIYTEREEKQMYKIYTYNKTFIGERSTWGEAKALASEFTEKNQKHTYIYSGGKVFAIYHPNKEREENKND